MKIFGRHKDETVPQSPSPELRVPIEPHPTAQLVGVNATPLAIAEAEIAKEPEEKTTEVRKAEQSLLETFDLKERVREAIKSCEVQPSREVQEALKGYYTDHYELANMIGVACGDTITDEELLEIISRKDGVVEKEYFDKFKESYQYASFPAAPSAESGVRLLAHLKLKERQAKTAEEKREAKDIILRCASASLEQTLFQETSLGITTLIEKDLEIIDTLFQKIILAAQDTSANPTQSYHDGPSIEWPVNNNHHLHRLITPKLMVGNIQQKINHFWDDCRMAGQLELHNTGHLPLIATRGNILLPRTEQHRRYGTMHVQTATQEQMHSVVPHFSEKLDTGSGYKIAGNQHGFVTEEVDRGAGTVMVPLADIIRVAPYARDAHYGIVEPKDSKTSPVSPPAPHNIESIGAGEPDREGSSGKDRVFFASSSLSGNPDSYEIKLGATTTILFVGDDIKDSDGYGSGYGFPLIERANSPGEASRKVYEAQRKALEHPIFKGKVVVPLRRHVFDFIPENMATVYNTAGRKAPNYNTNPLLQPV